MGDYCLLCRFDSDIMPHSCEVCAVSYNSAAAIATTERRAQTETHVPNTMIPLAEICVFLESFAPLRLAEDWDNVGLLIGDRDRGIQTVMTCLTVTPTSAAESIAQKADLIVAHHPLPFRAMKKITTETTSGRLVLQLAEAGIAVYSPHTAFDSAAEGINQQLAAALQLAEISPLVRAENMEPDPALGAGRVGRFPNSVTLRHCAEAMKSFLGLSAVRVVGAPAEEISKVAIACGSAGQFFNEAHRQGCALMITGEASFHTCLEAEATQTALMLLGHYASERFAVVGLAELISAKFPQLNVAASSQESDPLQTL
jgi:dinuclear metal center YbgI/SA1388 family protein